MNASRLLLRSLHVAAYLAASTLAPWMHDHSGGDCHGTHCHVPAEPAEGVAHHGHHQHGPHGHHHHHHHHGPQGHRHHHHGAGTPADEHSHPAAPQHDRSECPVCRFLAHPPAEAELAAVETASEPVAFVPAGRPARAVRFLPARPPARGPPRSV